MSEETSHEQRMYDYYKSIEDENFHLKRQLKRANNELVGYRKREEDRLKRLRKTRKLKYRNNGKGGK